ncbi:MAG TPA: ATP-binding cassette domain-containing protein [Gemmataceae bacterium]|nr:ATP-binding cassette domain-containing protein [Gemmataceae bacterium]
MSKALLSIRNLSVTLGGNPILRDLNVELERQRITAVIGLNGCGKTTLLRALLKEIPYTGDVRFHCGHDHRAPTPQHIGYVPQKLRIEGHLPLTVRDLLALALQKKPLFLGVSRHAREQMDQILDQVGAQRRLLDSPVDKISGGELQRILLGLALQPEPELLLLDEPAAGIDFHDQEHFYDLIGRLNRERKVTILLVSHDVVMVSDRAHHVLCLKDGRVQCQGEPRHVLSDEMLKQTFGSERAVFAHRHGG